MDINWVKFIVILFFSYLLLHISLILSKNQYHRLMLLLLSIGFLCYSGLGGADNSVPNYYIVFFFILFISLITGFSFSLVCFSGMSVLIGKRVPMSIGQMRVSKRWIFIIILYCLLSAFPLLWPEIKIGRFFSPPSVDLRSAFYGRFENSIDPISQIVGYIKILMLPFFYIALFRLRHDFRKIAFVLLLVLYLDYVIHAYLSRGEFLQQVLFFLIALWYFRPRYRKKLMSSVFLLMPFFLFSLYWYSLVRIGGALEDINIWDAITSLINQELNFPKKVGIPILESMVNADLKDFFIWIITIPIPKILTGPLSSIRINYEISEIILGLKTGSPGWYVVLPGLLSESIYIYGKHFFWFHGLFLGFLAGFFTRFLEIIPQAFFLFINITIMFGYTLNRGGISSLLPPLINQFLAFFIFIFFRIYPISFKEPLNKN